MTLISRVFSLVLCVVGSVAMAGTCKPVYLTLDTGNMRDANDIADFLKERNIKASFFLANEKTVQGGFALDASWAPYWRARVQEGHVFGSHTWRHGRIYPNKTVAQTVAYKPQFGESAGELLNLPVAGFCQELRKVSEVFHAQTGQNLSGLWRAPGGKLSTEALAAAKTCGFNHVGWSETGFLGDELDSKRYPNDMLVKKALKSVRSGDVLLAHLGIWSRQELFFPALKQIVAGLEAKGFCFKTLKDHPDYAVYF
jgi:peptidoglycan/xylan/chitin deacetylase (PgdA/CDA1 family)